MGKFMIEENPQVTFWKEECERAKMKLSGWVELYKEKLEFFSKRMKDRERMVDSLREDKDQCRRIKERLEREMKDFNALPWWKKMFFKFDV
jgi:hypothetical protein